MPVTVKLEVKVSQKLRGYLNALADIEGFGDTAEEVAERFIWIEVNRLIVAGRLTPAKVEYDRDGKRVASR